MRVQIRQEAAVLQSHGVFFFKLTGRLCRFLSCSQAAPRTPSLLRRFESRVEESWFQANRNILSYWTGRVQSPSIWSSSIFCRSGGFCRFILFVVTVRWFLPVWRFLPIWWFLPIWKSVLSIFCRPAGFCRFICGNCPVASRASADRWLLLVATSGGCPVATSGNLGYAAWLGKFQKIWESQSLFPWSSIAVGWEGWKKTDAITFHQNGQLPTGR